MASVPRRIRTLFRSGMCVVGVALGTQVVPEESVARLHAFFSLSISQSLCTVREEEQGEPKTKNN